MPLQMRFTLAYIFMITVVLLAWASLAHGAAINPGFSPSRRDLGEKAGIFAIAVSNNDIVETDEVASTDVPDGFVDDKYTLTARATEDNTEELVADGNADPSRRWYTLIEVAETPESE